MLRLIGVPLIGAAALVLGTAALLGGHCTSGAAGQPAGIGATLPWHYAAMLTEADLPESVPPAARALLTGSWWLQVETDGRYALYDRTGDAVVEGEWQEGDEPTTLVLTDDRGPLACREPGQERGTYRWARSADQLQFTVVADTCVGRRLLLTLPTYYG